MVKPIRDRAGAHGSLDVFRRATGRCEPHTSTVLQKRYGLSTSRHSQIKPAYRWGALAAGENIEPRFIPDEGGGVVDVTSRKSLVI